MTAEKIVPLTPTENPADDAPMSIPKPSKSTLDIVQVDARSEHRRCRDAADGIAAPQNVGS